jgi:hypothetical protein
MAEGLYEVALASAARSEKFVWIVELVCEVHQKFPIESVKEIARAASDKKAGPGRESVMEHAMVKRSSSPLPGNMRDADYEGQCGCRAWFLGQSPSS